MVVVSLHVIMLLAKKRHYQIIDSVKNYLNFTISLLQPKNIAIWF